MKRQNRKIVIHLFYDKSEIHLCRRILFFWVPVKMIVLRDGARGLRLLMGEALADELADKYKITRNHFIKYH